MIRTKEFLQCVDVLWMTSLRMVMRQGRGSGLVSGAALKGGVCDVLYTRNLLLAHQGRADSLPMQVVPLWPVIQSEMGQYGDRRRRRSDEAFLTVEETDTCADMKVSALFATGFCLRYRCSLIAESQRQDQISWHSVRLTRFRRNNTTKGGSFENQRGRHSLPRYFFCGMHVT